MSEQVNQAFGLPPAEAPAKEPSRDERVAALRAKAKAIVDATFDEAAVLAQLVEDEKAARVAVMREHVADDVPTREGVGAATSQGFPKKYMEILIFKGNQAQDLSYCPVGVNGYAWKIQRGEPVMVPSVVAETLEHAIEDITTQSEGGLITRPSHRFPFQVMREVSEEQYNEFVRKCKDSAKSPVQRV